MVHAAGERKSLTASERHWWLHQRQRPYVGNSLSVSNILWRIMSAFTKEEAHGRGRPAPSGEFSLLVTSEQADDLINRINAQGTKKPWLRI